MGMTGILSKSVRGLLDLMPHDYAVKAARKLRHELSGFSSESTAFSSARGDLYISGVRRTLGQSNRLDQFEPETLRWIDREARSGDILWDVGANVGLFACYFGRIPDLTTIAFEPFTVTCAELTRNLNANAASTKALNIGLSDVSEIGELELVSWEPGYTASTNANAHRFGHAVARQACLLIRGDDFANRYGAPTLMKIDVDGAEEAVLNGCNQVLRGLRSLIIEVEGDFVERFDRVLAPQIEAAGLQQIDPGEPSSGRNRIFTRPA